ncbi:sugar/nucleoside kinase (ribokinase family) [Antricoccus suffuscus]|uniref:Sugar/nucleoside kinase (Ribokinase family) n=1 Tax=Antricoccus suffuscus TaxID=1629062 RepID=A0A2T0ZZX3_9ACTN|nr:PfkB family carbohydrate kinase [Antricoccus suffuscus]PRZ41890.1 sugar/nucleoside kinase (ribokinase family) [Antricoccus suffuscus]
MTGRVIHTGQAIVDLVMNVDTLPPIGGDVFADHYALLAGGGFNVMAAARREGAEVIYAGGHGTGPFADVVRQAMNSEGVRVSSPQAADCDTGFCVALIDANAERTFVSTFGAEGHITADHLESAKVTADDIVYITGYSLYHTNNAATLGKWLPTVPIGASVVIDPSPMVGEIPDRVLAQTLARAAACTANEREARILLTRLTDSSATSPEEIVNRLADHLTATVIVRVGADGCWVAGPGLATELIPSIGVKAIDTNGAGDAHTGVLCADLSLGIDVRTALRRANVAAAIAVSRRGPATSPTRTEIDELIGE